MDEETEPQRGCIQGHPAGEWPRRDLNPGGLVRLGSRSCHGEETGEVCPVMRGRRPGRCSWGQGGGGAVVKVES